MRNLFLNTLLIAAVTGIAGFQPLDRPVSPAAAILPDTTSSINTSPDDPMANRYATFLMFEGDAAQAIELYTTVFPDAEIVRLDHFGPDDQGPEGTVQGAELRFGDQRLMFFDSPAPHNFTFTPSISIFVDFASEEDLERAYAQLLEGGEVAMPLNNYGFSRRFGWVNDRFGVSWQLNLP